MINVSDYDESLHRHDKNRRWSHGKQRLKRCVFRRLRKTGNLTILHWTTVHYTIPHYTTLSIKDTVQRLAAMASKVMSETKL